MISHANKHSRFLPTIRFSSLRPRPTNFMFPMSSSKRNTSTPTTCRGCGLTFPDQTGSTLTLANTDKQTWDTIRGDVTQCTGSQVPWEAFFPGGSEDLKVMLLRKAHYEDRAKCTAEEEKQGKRAKSSTAKDDRDTKSSRGPGGQRQTWR
jgi:hypothetical protein